MSDHNHDHDRRPPAGRKPGIPWWVWVIIFALALFGLYYFMSRDKAEAFTIEQGRGIVHYTNYQDGIDRSEACGIPLTMGRGRDAVPITYDAARALEDDTDRIQVTALVYVGDTFGPSVDDCPTRTRPPLFR